MDVIEFKKMVTDKKIICPECKKPVQQYEKFGVVPDMVWDGFGDTNFEGKRTRVTLICGNDPCKWQEKTEFWANYVEG